MLSRVLERRQLLTVVRPKTLIAWHRKGFRLFWRWKSRPPIGRKDATVVRRERLVVLLVTLAWACSGSKGTLTSPSPTTNPTTTFLLSGRVTNQFTGAAISGATVSVVDGPNAGKATTADSSGIYNFAALQQARFAVTASAANYLSVSQSVTLTSTQALNFPLQPLLIALSVTGRVTDAVTAAPIAGATVSIDGRTAAGTDNAGNYAVTGQVYFDIGNRDFTYASAVDYENDYHYVHGTVQNIRLYRIERMTAGTSKVLSIGPDDTLCVNNLQDSPGLGPDYLCRTVRFVVPSDGVLTVEGLSMQGGTHPPLEVEVNQTPVDWSTQNPKSPFQVAAGTEVVVHVEMPATSTTSQSFVVNTSMSRP